MQKFRRLSVEQLLAVDAFGVDVPIPAVDAPDLILESLSITSSEGSRLDYDYVIRNISNGPANLDGSTSANPDNVLSQAYLSADTIFNNGNDAPAGGTIIGLSPLRLLGPGESFTVSSHANQHGGQRRSQPAIGKRSQIPRVGTLLARSLIEHA